MVPVDLTIHGFCSKKNRKIPAGKGRVRMDPKNQLIMDRMALQIPGWARDLRIDSPRLVEWFFTYTNGHADPDGAITTMLDLLQEYGVILNDNFTHFGGEQIIHKAVKGEQDSIRVVIHP